MPTTVQGLTYRAEKGSSLTTAEQDGNTRALANAMNALFARFDAVFTATGALKAGAVSDISMISSSVIAQFLDLIMPLGSVLELSDETPPSAKWVIADGSAIDRTTYADYFALVGTTFGSGDGSTTFNIPDRRGRTAIGSGTGTDLTARTVGDQVGAETHELTLSEGMFDHKHVVAADAGADHLFMRYETGYTVDSFEATFLDQMSGTSSRGVSSGFTDGFLVTSDQVTADQLDAEDLPEVTAHNNMQPSVTMAFYVKVLA